jgi:hypothetical protein
VLKKGFVLLISFFAIQLLVISGQARADQENAPGIVLYPTFTTSQRSGLLSGDENTLGIDIRAGYRIASGFYFGLIYSSTTMGGTNTASQSALGDVIGYFYGGLSLMSSIYFTARSSETTLTSSVQRSEGLGAQLDLAYTFALSSAIQIGPVISYKNITYQTIQVSGSPMVSSTQVQISYKPYVGVIISF